MTSPAKSLYFPALDGLRFCAFLAVFIHHLPRSDFAPLGFVHDHGWVGVHIFLFLSAYLLTTILQTEQAANGRISIGRFLIRRALRIWPLYFVFCALTIAYAITRRGVQSPDVAHIIGLGTFTENWISGARGYSTIPYTAHLWTISLEEQFYLLLPWLLAIWLGARSKRVLIGGIAVLWLLFVGARCIAVAESAPHPWIWTSLFCADSLLLGTLLGARRVSIKDARIRGMCFVVGLMGLASPGFFPPIEAIGLHQVVIYTLIAIGAALVCISSINSTLLRPVLANRPIRYLGKISYGLYVYHLLAIEVALRIAQRIAIDSWAMTATIAFGITVAISATSYAVLEKRFLLIKRRYETVHTRPA